MPYSEIDDLIDDVLEADKYPDGTLVDREKIVDAHTEKWEASTEDNLFHSFGYEGGLYSEYNLLEGIFQKYLDVPNSHTTKRLDNQKVIIKARKGKIVIIKG